MDLWIWKGFDGIWHIGDSNDAAEEIFVRLAVGIVLSLLWLGIVLAVLIPYLLYRLLAALLGNRGKGAAALVTVVVTVGVGAWLVQRVAPDVLPRGVQAATSSGNGQSFAPVPTSAPAARSPVAAAAASPRPAPTSTPAPDPTARATAVPAAAVATGDSKCVEPGHSVACGHRAGPV